MLLPAFFPFISRIFQPLGKNRLCIYESLKEATALKSKALPAADSKNGEHLTYATTEKHIHDRFIEGCRRKDVKSQFALYQHYSKAMFNLCSRMLASRAEAEDVLQEAFLEAFTQIDSLKENKFFGAWLKKITVNKCISLLKKRRINWESLDQMKEMGKEIGTVIESEALERVLNQSAEMTAVEIEGQGSKAETARFQPEKVHEAIKDLPDGCRTVFTLYQLEGYDHEEIGQILGLTSSTSKSQLHRAKKLLQHKLKCQI